MLWAAIRKDTQRVLRDRGTLLSLFILPLVFATVFGSLFTSTIEDGKKARGIMLYRDLQNPAVADVASRIESSGVFSIRKASSADEVRKWVAKDQSRVGLILPADYDPRVGKTAELVIDEAAPMRFRGPIEGALRQLIPPPTLTEETMSFLEVRSPPGIKAPMEGASGYQVSVPGNAVLFGFFLALTMALSFVEERKSGTWRRLLAAPVRRPTLLVAKLVPYYLIGLVQMTFLFGVGALFFGMQVAGSVVALAALTCVVVFAAVSLGLLIASFGGNEKQVGSVGSIALLVMGLLGGAMMPRISMSETMQNIGLATPHAWALDGYYDLLLRNGASFADIALPLAMVLGFGLAFLAIGSMRFRFRP